MWYDANFWDKNMNEYDSFEKNDFFLRINRK